jgi:hypothetical protein
MNPASSNSRPGRREAADDDNAEVDRTKQTPGTDMQPEDAGTAESGVNSRGNAAEGAMKQTSKTGKETGSKR